MRSMSDTSHRDSSQNTRPDGATFKEAAPKNLPELAALLREQAPQFRDAAHEHLYAQIWEARQSFPFRMDQTHVDMAPALAWVFERTPMSGTLQFATRRRLRELGKNHRRHGFPVDVYPVFAGALTKALDIFDLSDRVRTAANRTITMVCQTMAAAAHDADVAGIPAAHLAEVVAVEHPNRFITVVRLETGMPVDYQAGDVIPITCDLLPGKWRELTPAAPADEFGQPEFHIYNCGDASQLLSTTRVGDHWTLGNPRPAFLPATSSELSNPTARGGNSSTAERGPLTTDRVIVAFGTGWASARAWLLDLLTATKQAGNSEPPAATCVYIVADSPGLLYDTEFQANLDILAPWLNLQQIVRSESDDRWLRAQPLAKSVEPFVSADPIATIVDDGPWFEFEMVLVGPDKDVTPAREQLLEIGFPESDVVAFPWIAEDKWSAK